MISALQFLVNSYFRVRQLWVALVFNMLMSPLAIGLGVSAGNRIGVPSAFIRYALLGGLLGAAVGFIGYWLRQCYEYRMWYEVETPRILRFFWSLAEWISLITNMPIWPRMLTSVSSATLLYKMNVVPILGAVAAVFVIVFVMYLLFPRFDV